MDLLPMLIIFFGLILRSLKYNVFLGKWSQPEVIVGIKAISIGYLFDLFIPFKLGILFRSWALSKLGNKSFTVNLAILIFERIFDLIIFIPIVVIMFLYFNEINIGGFLLFMIFILILILILSLYLIFLNKKLFLNILWNICSFFDNNIKRKILINVINIFYEFKRFFNGYMNIFQYIMLNLISWVLIFIGIAKWTFNSLGKLDLEIIIENFLLTSNLTIVDISQFKYVLYFPIGIIGLISLISLLMTNKKRTNNQKNILNFDEIEISDKVYFGKILYEQIKLILYFLSSEKEISNSTILNGGSKALTLKNYINEKVFIDKISTLENKIDLVNQSDYLFKINLPRFPSVIKTYDSSYFTGYRMNYFNGTKFYDYIHKEELTKSQIIIKNIFDYLYSEVYINKRLINGKFLYLEYFDKKIFDNVKKICSSNRFFHDITKKSIIAVNGVDTQFYSILSKVRSILESEKKIPILTCKNIHGDLTIENIIVTDDGFRLIDPSNNSNIISPILDLSRFIQSVDGSHEFINRNIYEVSWNKKADSFDFKNLVSKQYSTLSVFFNTSLVNKYITEKEKKYLNFFVGSFFIRLIVHNMEYSQQKSVLYLLKSIYYFDKFVKGDNFE